MGHSQEDLDRIERIASQNRALNNTDDQSRKATATLMEIERNLQLILVQQGAQVLEYERKKVAELKRRVQDQVRAQWEERRSMEQQQQPVDREVNCHSLNSVGSSEESRSSLTGSDAPTERLIDAYSPSTASSFNRFLFLYFYECSDDVLAKPSGPDRGSNGSTTSAPSTSITSILEVKVIERNKIIIFSGSFRRQEQPSLMNDTVLTGTLGNQHKIGEKREGNCESTQGGRSVPWPSIYNEELKSLPDPSPFQFVCRNPQVAMRSIRHPKVETVFTERFSIILAFYTN